MGKILKEATNVAVNVATGGNVGYDGGFKKGVLPSAYNKITNGGVDKILNGGKDLLFGKKEAAVPDNVIDLGSAQGRDVQEQAIGRYGQLLNEDTNGLAAQQIAQQENQVRQNAQDQEQRALQAASQRGVGRGSMGIKALLNTSGDTANQIGAVRASQAGLANQLRNQNLTMATQGVNSILGEQGQSRAMKMGEAGGRKGGISGLLGAGIGGYLGGAEGAKLGLNLGNAAGQI